MKKGKAELVFIVDRSGSMSDIASDMQGAIKSVLSDQKKKYKGDIDVTFVRFDSEYEEVFSGRSIKEVSEKDLEIDPRGATALLDAMGKTINNFERKFSEKEEKDRPEKVLFLIITDGGENASDEFSKDKVFGMIKTVERDHKWGFTFIGANQDAISEGSNIGVARGKSLNYAASSAGVRCMSQEVSNFTTSYLSKGDASYSSDDE